MEAPPSGKGKGKGAPKAAPKAVPKAESKPQRERPKPLTPEERRAKEQEEKQRQKEHFAALAPCDINDVPWGEAKEVWGREGGSGGVVLVDLGDRCVVLKDQAGKSSTAASELIAQHLAVPCGVRVAQCRAVRHDEAEHKDIYSMPVDAQGKPRPGATEEVMATMFKRYNEAFGKVAGPEGPQLFGVLEYVPGHPFMGMEANELLKDPSDELLQTLGQMCALDVLINNMDRLPLPIWANDGNFGNIMVSQGRIVGIDQQVNAIVHGAGRDVYFRKVAELVAAIKAGAGVHPGIKTQTNSALEMNTGVELSDEKLLVLQQGLRAGFEAISKSWKDGGFVQAVRAAADMCKERFFEEDLLTWSTRVYDPEQVERMATFVTSCAEYIARAMDAE